MCKIIIKPYKMFGNTYIVRYYDIKINKSVELITKKPDIYIKVFWLKMNISILGRI